MTPRVAAALADVAQLMRPAHHPWWIIGSGAVVLHGADAGDVHDIDVLIDRADAAAVLAAAEVTPLTVPPDPLFRSDIFAVWQGADVPVEIMAGFAIADPQGWWPVQPETREAIAVRDATLFVPARSELVALLRHMGRSKDLRRAAALEEREPG
ncbi:hypothetical protein [uncultured Sphingomonas sp.]|uniref:nucleotidyltransferase domain-containing protein n=1 Tax=uncultured Sphingomonas sp. TaxID=158754 RepID=UPI0025F4CB35|nr:hypothetical protein [uncultured Sphingomonas sp.]